MSSERFHLAGVIGHPVLHSRSPLIHGHWMAELGLKGAYLPLDVRPGDVDAALRGLAPLSFAGVNVTIPHKLDALRAADERDPVAEMIGAANCIQVLEDGRLFATNTDWLGFMGNVAETVPGFEAGAAPAVVLGAGGGARAVAYGLIEAGAPEVRLVNRTRETAEAVAEALGPRVTVVPWEAREAALEGAGILANTTSLGMTGQPELEIRLDALPTDAVVADIVYAPLETALLAAARARGNRAVEGLGMLLHQAVPAWELWFGITPEVTGRLRDKVIASLGGT